MMLFEITIVLLIRKTVFINKNSFGPFFRVCLFIYFIHVHILQHAQLHGLTFRSRNIDYATIESD